MVGNEMFAHLIGNNMEVYIDDMLVKRQVMNKYVKDLGQCVQVLCTYRMKLNPAKCSLGVKGASS